MNIKTFCLTGTLLLLSIGTYAQKKKETINDSNTPLHLLQPEYKVPYKALSTTEVKLTSTAFSVIWRRRLIPVWSVRRPEK